MSDDQIITNAMLRTQDQRRLENLEHDHIMMSARIIELEAENAALRADAERVSVALRKSRRDCASGAY